MQTRVYRGFQRWSDANTARELQAQELQMLRLQRHQLLRSTAQEPEVGSGVWWKHRGHNLGFAALTSYRCCCCIGGGCCAEQLGSTTSVGGVSCGATQAQCPQLLRRAAGMECRFARAFPNVAKYVRGRASLV
jgi:hypothetical protein